MRKLPIWLIGLGILGCIAGRADAAPDAVTNLTASRGLQLTLTWTAPSNGNNEPCGGYLLKYSTSNDITDDTAFNAASTWAQSWVPLTPGATETQVLTGLIPDTTYWFSLKASSNTSWSAVSLTGVNFALPSPFLYESKLASLMNGAMAWGDYDNDGDLDLAVNGMDGGSRYTTIYRNDNGTLVDSGIALSGTLPQGGGICWGDINNDGRLDLIYTGWCGEVLKTLIAYNNGNGTFTEVDTGIPGVNQGSLALGDFDNDGDLDLAITGFTVSERLSRIYRNDGGTFTDINAALTLLSGSSFAWGDYNNDGYQDLVHTGVDSGGWPQTYVCRNNGDGTFTQIAPGLTGVFNGSAAWADYNNDGWLDMVYCGSASGDNRSRIARNNGDGTFTEIDAGIDGVANGAAAWGDYDNDGYPDLAVTGATAGGMSTKIYRNNHDNTFTDINAGLKGLKYSSIAWGDLDGDGCLDLALQGYDNSGSYTASSQNLILYRSLNALAGKTNAAPTAPSGLSASCDTAAAQMILQWDQGSDTKTPASGLYYQVRVATSTVSDGLPHWAVSPSSGAGATPFLGNYPHGYLSATQPGLKLSLYPGTTYYWQVRSIDSAGKQSSWATGSQVYVPLLVNKVTGLVAARGAQVTLTWTAPSINGGGACQGYALKYSTSNDITDDATFNAASTWAQSWTPAAPGAAEIKVLTGLIPDTTYWFSLKASRDGVWSAISSTGTNVALPGPFQYAAKLMSGAFGAVAWGDYDNDGDLDLAAQAAGLDSSSNATVIFRNDNGVLVNSGIALSGTYSKGPGICWGDFNNDGMLDLLYTGERNWPYDDRKTFLAYNNGNGTFTEVETVLPGIDMGGLDAADFDNDGDLDIAITGTPDGGFSKISRIYRNDGGTFTDINAGLAGSYGGAIPWGDYDNDGYQDLAITGYSDTGAQTCLYRNNGDNTFTRVNPGLTNVYYGSIAWADYNNDGWLDLAYCGSSSSDFCTRIARNNGDGTFTEINAGITGVDSGTVSWGDFDNDGYPDLIVSGNTLAGGVITRVYRNNHDDTFTNINAGLQGLILPSAAWGDVDGDGCLDLALEGYDNSGSYTVNSHNLILYRSLNALAGKTNTPPAAPAAPFTAAFDTSTSRVTFSWGAASDAQTPANGLAYRVMISTASSMNGSWIVAPSSSVPPLLSGHPHGLRQDGSLVPSRVLKVRLENTTYYWQVAAVDSDFVTGPAGAVNNIYIPGEAPTVPDLLSPAEGVEVTTTTYDWSDSTDVVSGLGGYELQFSATTDFGTIVASSVTALSESKITPSPGALYWRVRSFDNAGNYSAWSSTRAVTVIGTPPTDVAFTGMSIASTVVVTTCTATDAFPGLHALPYDVQMSTDGVSWGAHDTSWIAYSTYAWTNLTPNTTYWFRVKARDGFCAESVFMSTTAAVTLARPPASTYAVSVTTSVTLAWSDNGNPSYTIWQVLRSTDNFAASSATVVGFGANFTARQYTDESLAYQTTYYYKVQARSIAGYETAFDTNVVTAYTALLPVAPSSFTCVALSTESVQFAWVDNSLLELGYRIRTSTGGLIVSLPANTTSWLQTGLTPGTTSLAYTVSAFGDAEASCVISSSPYTFVNQPEYCTIVDDLSVSSATVVWGANGNSSQTEYYVWLSTGGWFLETGWISGTTSYTFTGLSPNTELAAQVQARNGDHLESIPRSSPLGWTRAKPPSSLYAVSVTTSVTLAWSGNGNPAETIWRIVRSTDNFTASSATVVGFGAFYTDRQYTDETLAYQTTYYYKVQARNRGGYETAFDTNVVMAYTALMPVAPSSFTCVALSTGSVKFTWKDNSLVELGYRIRSSTGGLIVSLPANTTSWLQTDLKPNTTSPAYTVSSYGDTESSCVISTQVYTFANAPFPPLVVDDLSVSSATVAWNANENSPQTEYLVRLSTGPGALLTSGWISGTTSYVFTGLSPILAISPEVQARNGNGVVTDAVPSIIWWTRSNPPSGVYLDAISTGSIRVNWSRNGNPDYAYFAVRISTVGFTGTYQEFATDTTSYLFDTLSEHTTYWFRVFSRDGYSGYSAGVEAGPQLTLISKPAKSAISGVALSTSSIRWSWPDSNNESGFKVYSSAGGVLADLAANTTEWVENNVNPNTACSRYVAAYNTGGESPSEVLTRYTLTNAPYGVVVSSPTCHTLLLHWTGNGGTRFRVDRSTSADGGWVTVAGWANGITAAAYPDGHLGPATTYYYAVFGYNGDGIVTSSSAASGVTTALPVWVTVIVSSGNATQSQSTTGLLGTVKVDVPSGALVQDGYIVFNVYASSSPQEVTLTELQSANHGIANGNKLLDDSCTELTLYDLTGSSVTTAFAAPVTLVMSYADADNNGFVDNTTPPLKAEALRIFTLNRATLRWEPVGGAHTLDKALHTVTVSIPHFSMYALMAISNAETDLAKVKVYPNPFRPGSGGPQDRAAGIAFTRLTEKATIRIYTVAGELVFEGHEEDGDGLFDWPAVNSSGSKVASGVYIYVVTDPNDASHKAHGKIAIER